MVETVLTNLFIILSIGTSLTFVTSSKLQTRLKAMETRLKLAESRVDTLEMRVTMETTQRMDETMEVMESMAELNSTLVDLSETCVMDTNGVVRDANSGDAEDESTNAKLDRREKWTILAAISDEKRWLRERMEEVNEQLDDLEHDLEATNDIRVRTLVEDTTKQLLESDRVDFKTEMIELVISQGTEYNDKLGELRNDMDVVIAKHGERISNCVEGTLKIKNQLKIMTHEFEHQIDALKGTLNSRFQKLFECPDHWSRYDLFCYHFYDVAVEFPKARALCSDVGGHVVDMKDKHELEFVMGQVRGSNFWIGLTDSDTEGTWRWDRTGEITTFTNWRPGQPDNHKGTNQDCTIAGWSHPKDLWNDQGCHFKHAFVCKKSL